MHVNLALYLHCICTTENANKFSINCKMTKLNTQPILCAYGTRVLLSFFCGSLLVILKNAVNWIYGVIGIFIRTYNHVRF
jgi:hypothetical protein